jgi:hypothetical protein
MAVDKLHETATLARRDFDVGDFSEPLEKRTKFILRDVSGEAADENSRVVGVGKLVHRLDWGVRGSLAVVGRRGTPHGATGMARNRRHHGVRSGVTMAMAILVRTGLRSRRRDTHGAIAAINTLHLNQGTLLVLLIRETDESIAARLAGHRVRHDLRRLARGEAALEEGHEDKLIDLRAEIADEN